MHRRPVEPTEHLERRPRHRSGQPTHGRLEAHLLGRVHHPHIHPHAGLGRHHVLGSTGRRHGGRDGGTARHIAEGGHLGDQFGRGHQRVDAFLGFESGMRCLPMHHQFVGAHTLARRLQRTTVGTRFKHQHRPARLRPRFDERTRRLRTHFLIGGEQHLHTRSVRQRCHRIDRLHDARLHIEHTRPGGPTIGHAERSSSECAQWEHRVVMPHQEHLRCWPTLPMHMRPRRTVDDGGARTQLPLDHIGQHSSRRRERRHIVRGRLHIHQCRQVVEHLVEIHASIIAPGEVPGRLLR